MRTTIEIDDELRARLLALAARRGEKGFSGLVSEAIERYLSDEENREEQQRKAAALDALGSLSDEEADALEERTRRLREKWR
jgi:metal-responsive CopG/Arc/MetJ family transcriptional regulator